MLSFICTPPLSALKGLSAANFRPTFATPGPPSSAVGRLEITRSFDDGLTRSWPQVVLDTPAEAAKNKYEAKLSGTVRTRRPIPTLSVLRLAPSDLAEPE